MADTATKPQGEPAPPEFNLKSVPWRAWDAVWVFALSWIGLPLAVVIALILLQPLIPGLHAALRSLAAGTNITASFIMTLAEAALGLFLVGRYLRKYKLDWRSVGWRRFSWKKAVLMIIGIYAAFYVLVLAAYAIASLVDPHFNAAQPQTNDFTNPSTPGGTGLSFLALVIIPPIFEETIFRGFLFPALAKRIGFVAGAVITSVLFGLAHLQANVSVYTFVLSLLLCFMYVRLRSIVPGIFFHMLNNFIAFSILIK